jgi:hypothetical protein
LLQAVVKVGCHPPAHTSKQSVAAVITCWLLRYVAAATRLQLLLLFGAAAERLLLLLLLHPAAKQLLLLLLLGTAAVTPEAAVAGTTRH